MKLTAVLFGLLCASALVINAVPTPPQDQDDVRGAFITSRPKEKPASSSTTAKPTHRRPRPVSISDTKNNSGTSAVTNKNTNSGTAPVKISKPENKGNNPVNAQRLGLGLTLFMRDANGLAVRTDPARSFEKGDRVRVLLETNTDGYLYIFNTTNDGPAVMIYPSADLDDAGNYIQSHVPFEIPSSLAAEERLRWFAFDEVPGNERLFFVFTKEPLTGLPIEEELIALCRDSKASCPVKPTADVWAQVQNELKQPLQSDATAQNGRTQTPAEQQATSRGVGLAKDDPQPALIMMASSKTSRLVTTLDLVHK